MAEETTPLLGGGSQGAQIRIEAEINNSDVAATLNRNFSGTNALRRPTPEATIERTVQQNEDVDHDRIEALDSDESDRSSQDDFHLSKSYDMLPEARRVISYHIFSPSCMPGDEQNGCFMCCNEMEIRSFDELHRGDHIAIDGQICCLGRYYKHHAIVVRVEKLGEGIANVHVIDVEDKAKTYTCMCVSCCTCCCWSCLVCCCYKSQYPIREHPLADTTWRLPSTKATANSVVHTGKIRRLDYKLRRNKELDALKMARQFKTKSKTIQTEYCFCLQNCEHFACACVNGETASQATLKKSISIQSYYCFWITAYIIFLLLQTIFYFLDFFVYASTIVNDPTFDIFKNTSLESLDKFCSNPKDCVAGLFDTKCSWLFAAMFIFIYLVLFLYGHIHYYQPLFNRGFICKYCLLAARLDYVSRILAVVIIEAISVSCEDGLYTFIKDHFKDSHFWIVCGAVMFVSIIGTFLMYSLANFLTLIFNICLIPSWESAKEFFKYFKCRGICRLLHTLFVCIVRHGRICRLKCSRARSRNINEDV